MKTIIRLDASALKDSHCIRKLWLRTVCGYRGKGLSNNIHYGSCFHKYAEMIEQGVDKSEAMLASQAMYAGETIEYSSKNEYLEIGHLTRTNLAYSKERTENQSFTSRDIVKSPIDGSPCVECKFSLPIYVDETHEVLMQGTIDAITKIKSGCLCIEDFKTTQNKDPAPFFKGHRMSPQFLTYTWAIKQLSLAYPDGMWAKLLANNPQVGTRIQGVFLDPKKSTSFVASEVFFFTDQELRQYETHLMPLVQRLIKKHVAEQSGAMDMPPPEGMFNDTCKSSFGSYCPYFDMCNAYPRIGYDASIAMLDRHMKKVAYEPLNFGGGDKKV